MITKMDGGTFRMLSKDKRVAGIKPAKYGDVQGVRIDLAPGWQNDGANAGDFPDWESARNWVRKAVNINTVLEAIGWASLQLDPEADDYETWEATVFARLENPDKEER